MKQLHCGTSVPRLLTDMPANLPTVVDGIVKADGTLEILGHPELPRGPVRVTLERPERSSAEIEPSVTDLNIKAFRDFLPELLQSEAGGFVAIADGKVLDRDA